MNAGLAILVGIHFLIWLVYWENDWGTSGFEEQSINLPMMTKLKGIRTIPELRREKDWRVKMRGWFFHRVGHS
jgi:hypothetical protein